MSEWLFRNEGALRTASFIAVFGVLALAELLIPRRALGTSKPRRWIANLSIAGLDVLAVRLVSPSAVVGVAWVAAEHHWGLFNRVAAPDSVAATLSVLVLDLVIYLQHVAFHTLTPLWRLHLVHHADLDFDVTTGARFHPFEILLSLALKSAVVVLLGAPVKGALAFEALLSSSSLFNHSNVALPLRWDGALRLLLVTPDMHRVHHSIAPRETHANFGFCLPFWDRLLGTYLAQPRAGHDKMVIGLPAPRDSRSASLVWLLIAPFARVLPAPAASWPVLKP